MSRHITVVKDGDGFAVICSVCGRWPPTEIIGERRRGGILENATLMMLGGKPQREYLYGKHIFYEKWTAQMLGDEHACPIDAGGEA